MAKGFVKNHTSQLPPVIPCSTNQPFLDCWTVIWNKNWAIYDNCQLSGWTEKLKRFPKLTLHVNRDLEYCLLPIYPRPRSESQETITSEKYAQQTEMQKTVRCLRAALVREGPILLSVSSPWPYPTTSPTAGASKDEQTGFDEISYQVLPQDQTQLSLTS